MCGIAGIIRRDSAIGEDEIRRMTDALAHRGPDGEGHLIRDGVALGHRRLSIIDLDGGKQPMCNETGDIWVTYNGEIYNFRELRRRLEQKGHRFKSNCDTEVVVHAYEEYGGHCVEHFEGMFAFGILDLRRHELFLARDHIGIKPLVYLTEAGLFAFSSEIQALRMVRDVCLDIDLLALDRYLLLQYIPAPATIYRQVRKLPPGHRMVVGLDGRIRKTEQYWNIDLRRKRRCSVAQWVERLDAALADSVKRHLVADVPFGAFLSGGVDSSLVVGYMAKELGRPVKTFTISFDDQEFDESPYAQQVAKKWQTEHHEETVTLDGTDVLPDLVRHYGEPFGDNSAVPCYYLSQLARKHVPRVLSGDGGDEIFAGYGKYGAWLTHVQQMRKILEPRWKDVLYPLANRLMPARYPRLTQPEDSLDYWFHLVGRFTAEQRLQLWQPDYRFLAEVPVTQYESLFRDASQLCPLGRVQYLDMKSFLPDDILAKVDVASMMHGLEVRPPLLDRRFLELAATIPASTNLAFGDDGKPSDGKVLLKRLLAQTMGYDFAHRKKRGFSMPLEKWLMNTERGQSYVREVLTAGDARLLDYFDRKAVEQTAKEGHFVSVWLLLFLEHWFQHHSGFPAG
jgi:asparagine synthase (glutamine-hydrolysing)